MAHTPNSEPLSWQEIIRICSQKATAQIDDQTAAKLVRVFTSFRTNRAHGATPEANQPESQE